MKIAYDYEIFWKQKKFGGISRYFCNLINFSYKQNITSNIKVIDLITDNALVGSRGDAKRLIKQGAVSIDGNKVDDINFEVSKSDNPQILKAGKRKFIKIV